MLPGIFLTSSLLYPFIYSIPGLQRNLSLPPLISDSQDELLEPKENC